MLKRFLQWCANLRRLLKVYVLPRLRSAGRDLDRRFRTYLYHEIMTEIDRLLAELPSSRLKLAREVEAVLWSLFDRYGLVTPVSERLLVRIAEGVRDQIYRYPLETESLRAAIERYLRRALRVD